MRSDRAANHSATGNDLDSYQYVGSSPTLTTNSKTLELKVSEPVRVIMYRSPDEAALWESGMMFPLIVSLVVAFICAIVAVKVYEAFRPKSKGFHMPADKHAIIPIVSAIIGMLATLYFMS